MAEGQASLAPSTFGRGESAPPASTPPSEPSLFGGGEYCPDECSPCEYFPQQTLTFWRWGVLPRRVLPRRVLPSEPSAFVTNCDYLTLACVGRRGLATASGVSRAEVERTEGGADDGSLGGDGWKSKHLGSGSWRLEYESWCR